MKCHGLCFDFYYQPKPRQTGQNGCIAFVDTCLADLDPILSKENMIPPKEMNKSLICDQGILI